MLPQVDEVEYCPRHKIRIRNSPVSLERIGFRYHPASSVLTKDVLRHSRNACTQEWDALFNKEKDFFIQVSCNIDWLLQNGEPYAGHKTMTRIYQKISWRKGAYSWLFVNRKNLEAILCDLIYSSQLTSYLEHKNINLFADNVYSCLFSLRLCSHVLIMTALCGTPKAFYDL